MKKILILSTNNDVVHVAKEVCKKFSAHFDAQFCSDTEAALSIIDYEIPEIKVLDFSSSDIDCNRILSAIHADPWLHNGGIIAIAKNPAMMEEIENLKDPNILIVQTVYAFKENFQRMLRILLSNQQFLFNRGMQEQIGGREKGTFVCGNDPFDIRLYVSFLVNYLYCSNRITDDDRYALQTTLMELITNALEHGNCDISYAEKTACLEQGGNILDLIKEKLKDPVVAAKKITINYMICKDKSYFCIKDEGKGFDWRSRINVDYTEATHGRGIALSKSFVKRMKYNEKGNEVALEIENQTNASNNVPLIMQTFAKINYEKNQIVCKQNEPSNDLFFIVAGRYGVYVNRKLVSVLTPNDIFIGEMAFLLDDRRSATIVSLDEGRLIRVPKVSFVNLIRKNPHYGIFLSKLLAQRVQKQTQKTLALSAELAEVRNSLKV